MLFLQLKTGEYMTIGSDVIVQLNDVSGNRCKLMIEAPREIPVVRGELLERAGAERPECVMETARQRWSGPGLSWNRNKTQALIAMRRLLAQMDGGDDYVKDLRRQLDFLFPPEFASNETIYSPQQADFKRLTSRLKYSAELIFQRPRKTRKAPPPLCRSQGKGESAVKETPAIILFIGGL